MAGAKAEKKETGDANKRAGKKNTKKPAFVLPERNRSPTFRQTFPQLVVLGCVNLNFFFFGLFIAVALSGSRYVPIAIACGCIQISLMFVPLSPVPKWGLALVRYFVVTGSDYYPMSVEYEDKEAFTERPYVFGYEPHNVLPMGLVMLSPVHNHLLPVFKGRVRFLASSALFLLPVLRHFVTWMGFSSINKENFRALLAKGTSVVICPGGVQECLIPAKPTEDVAYLKDRKGFVRLAMERGCPLVPVFAFGQRHSYRFWFPQGPLFNKMSRVLKFAPMLFWGRWGSPIPYPTPIRVVVGKPIEYDVKHHGNPSREAVAETHAKFVEEMMALYERHKGAGGPHETTVLKIY